MTTHYRPAAARKFWCIDSRWTGAMTREQYMELWTAGKILSTTTNVQKVTCPHCLLEIKATIISKLGG